MEPSRKRGKDFIKIMENIVIPWTSLVERSDSFQLGDFGEKEESSLENCGRRLPRPEEAKQIITGIRCSAEWALTSCVLEPALT